MQVRQTAKYHAQRLRANGCSPYSVRAKSDAPIAAPLEWDELKDRELGSRSFTMANIFRRMGQREDPWRDMHRHAARIKTFKKGVSDLRSEGKNT